jgi:GWxTD domain-containing protein
MHRSTLPVALGALLLATVAAAQLSPALAGFPKSPAGFLMTAAEQKAFTELKTDTEAQTFVDLFWAKRDPNLDTVFNEFKADFDAKVAAADKQFGYPGGTGSLTDRAKVLYIMGRPAAPVENIAAPPADEEGDRPAALLRGAAQLWKYFKTANAKPTDEMVSFYFTESKPGAADFVLNPKDRRNKDSIKLLAEHVDKLVVNPKLTEVPRIGLVAGTKAATSTEIALLATEPKPWPKGAQVLAVSGLQSDSMHPIWLHVELPDAVAPATKAVGRVTRKDGVLAGTFATAVTAASTTGARAYQLSIPVEPGDYKVELALANETGTLALATTEIAVDPIAAGTTYFSPLYSGIDPRQEPGFKLGDPYNVGGWRIIPRASNTYTPAETLAYFCYIANPGKDETGNVKVTMALKLFIDGKPAGARPPSPVSTSKLHDTLFMFGSAMPLSSFTKPGEYRLEYTLRDEVTKVARTTTLVVTIPGAAAPAPAAPAAPAPPAK